MPSMNQTKTENRQSGNVRHFRGPSNVQGTSTPLGGLEKGSELDVNQVSVCSSKQLEQLPLTIKNQSGKTVGATPNKFVVEEKRSFYCPIAKKTINYTIIDTSVHREHTTFEEKVEFVSLIRRRERARLREEKKKKKNKYLNTVST